MIQQVVPRGIGVPHRHVPEVNKTLVASAEGHYSRQRWWNRQPRHRRRHQKRRRAGLQLWNDGIALQQLLSLLRRRQPPPCLHRCQLALLLLLRHRLPCLRYDHPLRSMPVCGILSLHFFFPLCIYVVDTCISRFIEI